MCDGLHVYVQTHHWLVVLAPTNKVNELSVTYSGQMSTSNETKHRRAIDFNRDRSHENITLDFTNTHKHTGEHPKPSGEQSGADSSSSTQNNNTIQFTLITIIEIFYLNVYNNSNNNK